MEPTDNKSQGNFSREMVKGSWNCSDCEKEITELPFEPAPDRPIYCKECWLKRRDQRPRR